MEDRAAEGVDKWNRKKYTKYLEEEKVAQKGDLLSFRPDIKVLDATIRDGGLVNDFYFTDEFIHNLYKANVKAGVDYMEFGYRADKEMFDVDAYGPWMMEDAHRKGYETTCNFMAISNAKESDINKALEMLGKSCVDGIYIVDSFGSLFPEQIRTISDQYMEVGEKYGKYIGMHAHNNQQLAFANTIESCARGVSYLDATMSGMGRGAGNCCMELLLGFLKNPKYKLFPIIKFIEQNIVPLKEQGVEWGFDIPYLLTGHLNQHPRAAIAAMKEGRKDYSGFYKEIIDKD